MQLCSVDMLKTNVNFCMMQKLDSYLCHWNHRTKFCFIQCTNVANTTRLPLLARPLCSEIGCVISMNRNVILDTKKLNNSVKWMITSCVSILLSEITAFNVTVIIVTPFGTVQTCIQV